MNLVPSLDGYIRRQCYWQSVNVRHKRLIEARAAKYKKRGKVKGVA